MRRVRLSSLLAVVASAVLSCSPGSGGSNNPPVDDQNGGEGGGDTGGGGAAGGGAGGSAGQNAGGTTAGHGGGGDTGSAGHGGAGGTASGGAGGMGTGGVTMTGGGGGAGMGGMTPAQGGGGGAGSVGPTACPQELCDDFESYASGKPPGAPTWTSIQQTGATVAVDSSKAYSGKQSVKITVNGGDGGQGQFGTATRSIFPITDQLYARMMVYIDSTPTGDGHWTWMQTYGWVKDSAGKAQAAGTFGIGGHPSAMQNVVVYTGPSGIVQDCWDYSAMAVPTKRWACVEWHLDDKGDSQEVWVDSNKVNDLSFMTRGGPCTSGNALNGDWPVPDLILMNFGWTHYHNLTGTTLWIDDVALDSKRVGCPKP